MHTFRAPLKAGAKSSGSTSAAPTKPSATSTSKRRPSTSDSDDDGDDEENHMFPQPEGDDEGGFSYHGSSARGPRMNQRQNSKGIPIASRDEVDGVFDGDHELRERLPDPGEASSGETELVPYAHRDLKPGYVSTTFSGPASGADIDVM